MLFNNTEPSLARTNNVYLNPELFLISAEGAAGKT